MLIAIQIIHVLVSVTLILFILLQTGKGADLGAMFGGGGSNTLFGASGAGGFLSKMTTYAAVVFMFTSLGLAYISAHPATAMTGGGTVMEETGDAMPTPPAEEAAPVVEKDTEATADAEGETKEEDKEATKGDKDADADKTDKEESADAKKTDEKPAEAAAAIPAGDSDDSDNDKEEKTDVKKDVEKK